MSFLTTTSVLFLFFLTGLAGLIYEVVWLRMLVRVFGSTSLATSNVLAVFMAGLALGAWLAGRRAKTSKSPLTSYGLVECCLALSAALASVLLPKLPGFAASIGPQGPIDSFDVIAFRSLLSACVLLLPTILMGASFPLLAEHFAEKRERSALGSPTAILYGVNTLGAVSGVLLSGYVLLGRYGESRTIIIAVAVNVAVGTGAAFIGWRRSDGDSPTPTRTSVALDEAELPRKKKRVDEMGPASVLASRMPLLMAVSGFCALGLEVLWTRLLVLLLGNSIYAFSAMLAANLLGIGIGSLAYPLLIRKSRNHAAAFINLQILAAAAIVVAAELYMNQGLARLDASYLYSPIHTAADFYRLMATSSLIVLPAALVYGTIFPLSISIADPTEAGESAGRIYALNTIGAVLGSLACGLIFIPAFGTRVTVYMLAGTHLGVALLAAEISGANSWGIVGGAAGFLLLLSFLRPDPFLEIIKARLQRRGPGEINFHFEGASSTVTEYVREGREHLILINGIIVSGKGDLGRMMAHFPLILQEAPKRALVICLGAGNTFRAAVDHGVEVDLSELEQEVIAGFPRLWPDAQAYLGNPRVHIHVNDGRNFLLSTDSRYDMIVIDGTPPIFSAGTVNLYSQEFVELAHRHLTKNGIMALWIPLPCFERDFWMIARNFTDTFNHTLAWAQPGLQGILLLGSDSSLELSPKAITQRAIRRGLIQSNMWLNETLLDPRRIVSDAALRAEAVHYPNVTDDRPYTEFPLPAFAAGAPLRGEPDFLPFSKK